MVAPARYYFHLRNGQRYPDESGKVFSSTEAAIAHAALVASELTQDEGWEGFEIVVTDQQGNVITRVPVEE
jgi:hypothetical protein